MAVLWESTQTSESQTAYRRMAVDQIGEIKQQVGLWVAAEESRDGRGVLARAQA